MEVLCCMCVCVCVCVCGHAPDRLWGPKTKVKVSFIVLATLWGPKTKHFKITLWGPEKQF